MGKKILVVDDEENIRTFLAKSLESKGYQVISASDGVEGWKVLESERPDLVILDVRMPGMDGIEFLEKIRGDTEFKKIPVIMLTAESSDMSIISGLSMGADHYITKPFTISSVLTGIKMMFEEK